jgi:hypothetical protein
MIASGEACAGESPAVCTTCTTPPSAVAVLARVLTESWEATSTVAVGVLRPAACKVFAAATAVASLTSPSKIVLATPIRRAIALTDGARADDDDHFYPR